MKFAVSHTKHLPLHELPSFNTIFLCISGIKESDTGLAPPSNWDLVSDKQMLNQEQPLQVAHCTKIINPGTPEAKYMINVKQIAKFVVALGDRVSPTDIEEAMRVGYIRFYFLQFLL